VTFTTAQASSHVYPSTTDFEALTALTDVEKTVDINYAGVYSDTVIQVSARFDNDGVETAYLINTLGFFAQLGTDTPILFAVSTAVTPDQMPVFDADNPSAFIYNMQMTVQNADSINLSVNPAGTVTVEQLNAVVNTINANIGDLSNLTTDDKTSLVNAINEVDAHVDNAQASVNNAQQMIAPIQTTLTASQNYAIGEQFVYNGLLYKATAAIAQGGAITIDGNCESAENVTEQILKIGNWESFEVTFSSDITDLEVRVNNNYYNPITKQVILNIIILSRNGLIPTGSRKIASVPNKYKPSANRAFGFANVKNSLTSSIPPFIETCSIESNGNIFLVNYIYGVQTTYVFGIHTSYVI
jgi:hypothetical protein